jgi:hypothetical protein
MTAPVPVLRATPGAAALATTARVERSRPLRPPLPGERIPASLQVGIVGAALALGTVAAPLGLDRVGAAGAAAATLSLRIGPGSGTAPAVLLWDRLFACVPLGDVATRLTLAAAAAAALVALFTHRLCRALLLEIRPAMTAVPRPSGAAFAHEPPAALGASAVAFLSAGAFAHADAGTALSAALVVWALALAAEIARDAARPAPGLALAFACGLTTGAAPIAFGIVAPPSVVLWIWSLRRGERWPLVAPLAFVAGVGVLFVAIAAAEPAARLGDVAGQLGAAPLRHALAIAQAPRVLALGRGPVEDAGVLALLVAGVGLLPVLARAPACAALLLFCGWAALVGGSAASPGSVDAATAHVVLASLIAAPTAAGLAHLAGKLGRARWHAAVALAVIVAVAPALDGGAARWAPARPLAGRLLDRALDRVPVGATVDPGSPELRALFGYAQAIGLRPDAHVR